MKNEIIKFEKLIKIKFKNKSLLKSALIHKSANLGTNNEKLEFLGDRVLGLVLSKKLFDLYPNENEGVLDKRFANLVKKETCCEIALDLNIQNFIISGNKKLITKNDKKILSDCCEALIGAIFIDKGFAIVSVFILNLWKNKLAKSNITILDPKTKLQEYSLKNFKKLPKYLIVDCTGPKHNPLYKISVSIVGSKTFIGQGNSKQQAEQDSAKKLINYINI
jgi:ribonuclease III